MNKLNYLSLLLLPLMCGLYEIFNESGDGARHAMVIYAERGKMLRMEGPLGLSGQAITLVFTYSLKAWDDTPDIVKQVWEQFLWEQFIPYIEEHFRHSRGD